MFGSMLKAAHDLDQWLEATLGRPYRVVLSVGLTIEIMRRISELPETLRATQSLLGVVALIVMNLALLINQLGEMSRRVEARRRSSEEDRPRRGRRRGEQESGDS